jgi:hypothetical protein
MANVKFNADDWGRAREYYESGLSLSKIQDKTGIDRANISKKAKLDGWVKNNSEKQQLILDDIRVTVAKTTMSQQALDIHNELVDDKTRKIIRYDSYQDRLAAVGMAMIEQKLDKNGKPTDELSPMELTAISRVVKDSREGVVGKAPDTAIQINNNNNTTAINTMTRADRERRLKELMGDV